MASSSQEKSSTPAQQQQELQDSSAYMAMQFGDAPHNDSTEVTQPIQLTHQEMILLQRVLHQAGGGDGDGTNTSCLPGSRIEHNLSMESDYTAFAETTHAWAVFADDPAKRATKFDRMVGSLIIVFQLFTYSMFAKEAIEDYGKGQVQVMTTHANCLASNEAPQQDFACEAEYTSYFDAIVAFVMLSFFLTPDFLSAFGAMAAAPDISTRVFACLAGFEVLCAFVAASISISFCLYIGEVRDAVEVGVGLLFIRELSTRAYHGIRTRKKTKRYKAFFGVLGVLVMCGLLLHPVYVNLLGAQANA